MNAVSSQLLEGVDVMAAVVDTRSFGAAADMLDMSQSGVSRSVARLEARLGIRVFERTTRSVRLTDEGRAFYEQVMPLISALQEATALASGDAKLVRGRLRINVDALFAQLVLSPQLGDFMDRYPELELELRSKEELGDLITDGFDLALRFGQPQSSSLVARKLFDTRVMAVATPAYLQRFGHPKHPAELEQPQHRCIQFREPFTGKPFPWLFQQKRKRLEVRPKGALLLSDPGTLNSACLAGAGIAQLLEMGMQAQLASGQLVSLFPEWSDLRFPLYAYYPSRHHVPAKTRAMLEFVAGLVKP